MDNPQQIKILVVEDDLSSRIIMEAILSKLGYQVCATDSGIHAIDLLKKTPFDVVLMDLVMPEIGGYETTLRIRREHTNGFHPNIPILALTADSTSDTLRQCQEIGMNGCLTKPVNPATLPLFIRQCLDGAQWVTPIKSDDQPLDDPYSSHPESMDLPTLDWNMTLRNVGGDASRARTILSIGLEDLPPLLHRLAHAFQAGDYRQAKLLAHTIKGESGNLGAQRLRHLAIQMESLLDKAEPNPIQEQIVLLQNEFQHLLQAIHSKSQNPLSLEKSNEPTPPSAGCR